MASRLMVVGIVSLVLVSGFGIVHATQGPDAVGDIASSDHSENTTIRTSASAEVSTAPDTAIVRLSVVATADTADAARNQVAEDATAMRSALRDQGVEDDQVQTTYYDISPRYDDTKNGSEIVGYRAAHGFQIDVTVESGDLGLRTGSVLDTAVGNGATQVDGVQFTLAEETRREVRHEALEVAMENAREDAAVLASTDDISITGLRSASTADVSFESYQGLREGADGGGADTVFEPGHVRVSATVSVTFSAE